MVFTDIVVSEDAITHISYIHRYISIAMHSLGNVFKVSYALG